MIFFFATKLKTNKTTVYSIHKFSNKELMPTQKDLARLNALLFNMRKNDVANVSWGYQNYVDVLHNCMEFNMLEQFVYVLGTCIDNDYRRNHNSRHDERDLLRLLDYIDREMYY